MGPALLFAAALLGMFSIVPLATWAATGSLREAGRAAGGYAVTIAVLVVPALLLVAISFIVDLML